MEQNLRTLSPAALLVDAHAIAEEVRSSAISLVHGIRETQEAIAALRAEAPADEVRPGDDFKVHVRQAHAHVKRLLTAEAALAWKLGAARLRLGVLISKLEEDSE